ncbi:hypothetical protein SAM40697_3864 [Streptomyces ambofaciens]|uniref:Uncharacterized protein n=1 Tax=Streptomyces ambofaciens TaxID=1889 RepID=A0ABM6B2C2_STRAM|nr:hypothetical protein SAM40697_3864 [Streptomyces ambofaciens]
MCPRCHSSTSSGPPRGPEEAPQSASSPDTQRASYSGHADGSWTTVNGTYRKTRRGACACRWCRASSTSASVSALPSPTVLAWARRTASCEQRAQPATGSGGGGNATSARAVDASLSERSLTARTAALSRPS